MLADLLLTLTHLLSCKYVFLNLLLTLLQKERDLELAARIGTSLLEQNKSLKNRNDELEQEVCCCNETVSILALTVDGYLVGAEKEL